MTQPTDIARELFKIVLVEANEHDTHLVTRILVQHAGPRFTVALAESLAGSHRVIDAVKPDLILLDLDLPDGRGLELLHRMRDAHLLVPIVVITSHAGQGIGLAALNEGAQNYWIKTASNGELLIHVVANAISDEQSSRRDRLELDRIARGDRVETVGRMTLSLVHDFKNMLMVIQGNAALLQCGLEANAPGNARIGAIELAVQEGVRVCRQLLAFCKGNAYQVVTLDLDQVVSELLPLLVRAAGSETGVEHRRSLEPVYVCADRAQLTQVIMNLVLNATESLGDSGRIVIETRRVSSVQSESEPNVTLPSGAYGELIVTDDGCGMDAATQAHIFDEFYTTKAQGSGLGLSIVSGAVQGAGGRVAVDSTVGVGSRFRVYLPTSSITPAVEPKLDKPSVAFSQLSQQRSAR